MKKPSLAAVAATTIYLSTLASNAQTNRLTLEHSNDLHEWESVALTPEMLDEDGNILVPGHGPADYYRLRVEVLEPPAIDDHPPETTQIHEGGSVTLSVDVAGEGLAYQWFLGESGDGSQPIEGATAASLDTGELFEDASY